MNNLPWPADKVERRSLNTLIPYARNSRQHSELQISQLAASMQEWGWTNPVLIDEDGGIIAGHGRVLVLRCAAWLMPRSAKPTPLSWRRLSKRNAQTQRLEYKKKEAWV